MFPCSQSLGIGGGAAEKGVRLLSLGRKPPLLWLLVVGILEPEMMRRIIVPLNVCQGRGSGSPFLRKEKGGKKFNIFFSFPRLGLFGF